MTENNLCARRASLLLFLLFFIITFVISFTFYGTLASIKIRLRWMIVLLHTTIWDGGVICRWFLLSSCVSFIVHNFQFYFVLGVGDSIVSISAKNSISSQVNFQFQRMP